MLEELNLLNRYWEGLSCTVLTRRIVGKDSFMMESTHLSTACYLDSTHGEHISGEQAVAQANSDALHSRSTPCWDSNYRRFC